MTKLFTTFITLTLICNNVIAQAPTHRLKFKYRLTQKVINDLTSRSVILKDANNNAVNLCTAPNSLKVIKCLVTNKDGLLTIDPWKISDSRTDPSSNLIDPCYGNTSTINAGTQYPLKIDIQRGFSRAGAPGTPVLVGHPTKQITLHYQTWLIGVNTSAVKFRPSVKDYNGNEYSPNAITGTINAGLTIGYSFGWTTFTHRSTNSWSITPAFSLGLASASLAKEPLKKQVTTTYNPSNFIISPALGVIFARNDVGVFFTYGHDFMTGRNSDAWAYQGKHFFGIGLSAGFKL